jgi:hypothetical protein
MNTKELVISIIQQEMRIKQYVIALRKLGIEFAHFEPDLMHVVSVLMHVNASDEWMELYVSELNKCEYLSIEPHGRNLKPLAEVCYYTLLGFNRYALDDDLEGANR